MLKKVQKTLELKYFIRQYSDYIDISGIVADPPERNYNIPKLIKARLGPKPREIFDDRQKRKNEMFFVPTHRGIEKILANELKNPLIGARNIKLSKAGVTFKGENLKTGYSACLWLRTGLRVLSLISKGRLLINKPAAETIRDFVMSIYDWENLISPGSSISVKSVVWASTTIKDNLMASEILMSAVSEALKEAGIEFKIGIDPKRGFADVPLFMNIYRNYVMLYRDMSGYPLSYRGYKQIIHNNTLNECAAAGLLYMAEWDKIALREDPVLFDPMCGSGTFLHEAALMGANMAPGLYRENWPFFTWPDFDFDTWKGLVFQAREEKRRNWKGKLLGCDVNPLAVLMTKRSNQDTRLARNIKVFIGNCGSWDPKCLPDVVITNPPWALKHKMDIPPKNMFNNLKKSWMELGQFIWERCRGGKIYVLCSRKSFIKQLIVKSVHRYPVMIKGIEASLYTIFMHDTNAVILNEHWMNKMKKKLENKVNEERIRLEKTRSSDTIIESTTNPVSSLSKITICNEDEKTGQDEDEEAWIEPIESGYEL